jgi:hypothetical protein
MPDGKRPAIPYAIMKEAIPVKRQSVDEQRCSSWEKFLVGDRQANSDTGNSKVATVRQPAAADTGDGSNPDPFVFSR